MQGQRIVERLESAMASGLPGLSKRDLKKRVSVQYRNSHFEQDYAYLFSNNVIGIGMNGLKTFTYLTCPTSLPEVAPTDEPVVETEEEFVPGEVLHFAGTSETVEVIERLPAGRFFAGQYRVLFEDGNRGIVPGRELSRTNPVKPEPVVASFTRVPKSNELYVGQTVDVDYSDPDWNGRGVVEQITGHSAGNEFVSVAAVRMQTGQLSGALGMFLLEYLRIEVVTDLESFYDLGVFSDFGSGGCDRASVEDDSAYTDNWLGPNVSLGHKLIHVMNRVKEEIPEPSGCTWSDIDYRNSVARQGAKLDVLFAQKALL